MAVDQAGLNGMMSHTGKPPFKVLQARRECGEDADPNSPACDRGDASGTVTSMQAAEVGPCYDSRCSGTCNRPHPPSWSKPLPPPPPGWAPTLQGWKTQPQASIDNMERHFSTHNQQADKAERMMKSQSVEEDFAPREKRKVAAGGDSMAEDEDDNFYRMLQTGSGS